MQSKTLIGLALWATLSLTAVAQPTNQNVRSLSLQDCLNLALAHNLDIQIGRYTPQIANYLLRSAYGAYDPNLGISAKRTFVDQPSQFNPKKWPPPAVLVNNNLLNFNNVRLDSEYELTVDSVRPGINGRLPSGLTYDLFARSDHLDAKTFPSVDDIANIPPNLLAAGIPALTNDYYATVGIELRQPLLKDFWIDKYRETIQIHKKNQRIADQQLRSDIMNIVTKVATAYYDLTFSREQVKVERGALELAGRLLQDTQKKVKAGTLTPLDEEQAESDLETIRTALFAAEQNYSRRENNLKNLVTDNYQSWMETSIVPSENLLIADLPSNRTASWVNALTRRPDILQARLELEKQDIALRFTYNQLFPSLDLVGSYGWQAVQRGFGGSWGDIKDGQNPFYSVGVVFSIPLGNITARNEHKANQLAKKQAMLKFQKLEQDVITEVDTAVKLAETTYKQITSTRKAREFSQQALESMQKQYEAGTQTAFFVVQAQRNLTLAKSAEIRALADYNIALAQLALSEGTALDKNQIDLKLK